MIHPRRSQEPVPSTEAVLSPTPTTDAYRGCWSSGSGKILRITEKEFHSSTNSYKPVKYEQLNEPTPRNTILLRLANRPRFYFFQEFVEVIPFEDPDFGTHLRMLSFVTPEDVNANKISGRDAWIQSDCSELFPE
jgi:hypothetical protein